MVEHRRAVASSLLGSLSHLFRKCLFSILSFGPMPNHIAIIMDGNRRYAKRRSIRDDTGHRVGFSALMSTLRYCYEMGVKYVTVYAFSIDNFKRGPTEVQSLMNLMKEKLDELQENDSIIARFGARVNFWGNLNLLSEPVKLAANKLMMSTAKNNGPVLSVCLAYTTTNEIVHAVEEICVERRGGNQGEIDDREISTADLERHLYTANCPDPDILIRTSGETRLSNFLLWQTTYSHLQNPSPLWPEFSLRHLVWTVLEYQRVHRYLDDMKRQTKKES